MRAIRESVLERAFAGKDHDNVAGIAQADEFGVVGGAAPNLC
jgi:hypothetical protein